MLLIGGVVAAAACLAPVIVRHHAPGHYDLLGASLGADSGAPARASTWLREASRVSLGLSAVGLLWSLVRRRARTFVVPLLVAVACDVLLPARMLGEIAPDALASVRLIAVVAVALAAALGLQAIVIGVRRLGLPFARTAGVAFVVFHFMVVLLASEDAAFVADRRSRHGAEVWTDEALAVLPPRSLVLVRSSEVAWRLWASRVVRGQRPDLVVVPLGLVDRPSVVRGLLRTEPLIAALARDVATTGNPSEIALSTLADARPLYLELDPSWNVRLLEHLAPAPLWFRFATEGAGRSDRAAALDAVHAAFARVAAVATLPDQHDATTLRVLTCRARQQAVALAALGDREAALGIVADLRTVQPDDPFLSELTRRVGISRRGGVDVAGLVL
jgi:hypothetical protein